MNTKPHPLIAAAAQGGLPAWTVADDARRAHMARVAELMGGWAGAMGLATEESARWRAAGLLHDVLRDAPPSELVRRVPPRVASLPGSILHGPAAAERLRVEGILDGEFLAAIAYHTTGHPSLGRLGRALYCADFLEPGRDFEPEWRAELRERVVDDLDQVTREIVSARIAYVVRSGLDLLPDTVALWNVMVEKE